MVEKYKLITRILYTTLWIQLCWGFVCSDIMPSLEVTRGYVTLLFEAVILVLGIFTIRERRDIIVMVSFFIITAISLILNHIGVMMFVNGFRDFIGLIFVAPVIRWLLKSPDGDRFVKSTDKMLYVFLWLQLPCLVFQFLRYGANDHGGGTLGNGGSGIVSTFIFVISFYLMNKRWDDAKSFMHNIWDNKVLLFLLLPTALNETKISFLYLGAYILLLSTIDKKFISKTILLSPIVLVLFMGMGYLYLTTTGVDEGEFDEGFLTEYLVGEDIDELMNLAMLVQDEVVETDNVWVMDLPRYGRLIFMQEILGTQGGGMLFGAGLGQFKGGTYLDKSAFAQEYEWWLKGSVIMLFFIVVQLGLAGLVWIIYNFVTLLLTPGKNNHRKLNIRFYMAVVTLLIFSYNDMFRNCYVCFLMFYIYMYCLQPSEKMEKKNEESVYGYI